MDGMHVMVPQSEYLRLCELEETVAALNEALNEAAGKWARADAELHANDGTRWQELFGTPDRAAETLAMNCFGEPSDACGTCVFDECDGTLRRSGSYPPVYDAMLGWLRGEERR